MLDKRLTEFDYYFSKLSLFMKNSYGIKEMTELFVAVLQNLNTTIDDFFEQFAVTNQDALAKINELSLTKSDILDSIASIYGVTRDFNVKIDGTEYALHLNNEELLILIKAKMYQNNFDGTRQQTKDYYKNLSTLSKNVINIYPLNANETATCLVYMLEDSKISDNIRHMFNTGLLTIKSAGIKYVHNIIDIDKLAIFNSEHDYQSFDYGIFSD